jgi:predicted MFS family arabinose efflux permease
LAAVVGGFLCPAMLNIFGEEWGWRGCFFLSILPALLVFITRRTMPESDVWLARRQATNAPDTGNFMTLIRTPRLRRLFGLGLVLALSDMSAYWFTYTWLPQYLYEKLGFSMARSGFWMLVGQLGGLLGYLSFGIFADWKGRRIAYTVYSLIWAAGLLAITWFWHDIMVWPLLTLAFMFLVGLGTGNFSGYGPIFAELFPTQVRSTAMGAAFNLARGVQFFTPLAISLVASRYGLGGGISLAAFFALFTGTWVWMLPETKGTRITPDEEF